MTSTKTSSFQPAASHWTGPFRKVIVGLGLFVFICIAATAGYVLAGWELFDAFYMVVITIFGVGYGEVRPITSPALRSLTIMVIVCGYGAVIYTVGGFMQMLIDGELNRALGARRMTKGIERLENHTIICGIGRLGTILARELHTAGKPFVAVETDERRLQDAEEKGYLVIQGDATDEGILEQAGIRRASMVATVLSDDAINVFVTITARAMNADVTIIARGENPRTEKKLLGCGANKVVLPTAIGAHKIAQMVIRPSAENLLEQISQQSNLIEELGQLGLQFNEMRVEPNSTLVDQLISQIEIQSNHGFLIVGVRHADGKSVMNPPIDTKLQVNDVVIVLGHSDDIPKLAKRFTSTAPQIQYRGAKMSR